MLLLETAPTSPIRPLSHIISGTTVYSSWGCTDLIREKRLYPKIPARSRQHALEKAGTVAMGLDSEDF